MPIARKHLIVVQVRLTRFAGMERVPATWATNGTLTFSPVTFDTAKPYKIANTIGPIPFAPTPNLAGVCATRIFILI